MDAVTAAEPGFGVFADWQRTAYPHDATEEKIAEWWRVSGALRKAAWAGVEKRATDAEAERDAAIAEAARLRDLLNEASIADPAPACPEPHPPTHRCFDCATDDELAAAIPPFPGTGKDHT